MADDRWEPDQDGAEPDGEAAGVGGRDEPAVIEGAGSGDSTAARSEPPAQPTAAPSRAGYQASPQAWPPQAWPPQAWPPQAWPPQAWPPQAWPPQAWPPQAWPPQAGYGQWPQPGQWQPGYAQRPQSGPWDAWPGAPVPVAWPGAPVPVAWPGQLPSTWAVSPGELPIGYVPWGYSKPPQVPLVLEPPGRFHPRTPLRTPLSLMGRVSPRLYAAGLALSLPGLLALLFLEVGSRVGWKSGLDAVPAWVLVETICAVAAVGLIVSAIAQSRQRRADGWQDYAGPSPFLVMAALLAIVTGVGLPLAGALAKGGVDTDSATGVLLLLLVYLGAYLGLVHFLAVRPGALTWRDIIRPRHLAPDPDDWTSATPETTFGGAVVPPVPGARSRISGGPIGDILLALAILLPIVLVSGIVNQALLLVLGLDTRDLSSPVPTSSTRLDPLIAILAVAVIVPIGEEVFFRGFATNAWGRSLGRNSAILRAALFFAFIHTLNVGDGEPGFVLRMAAFNFGARIPVAIALTWLYFRRRSILACGTLHASYNGLIQLVSILVP